MDYLPNKKQGRHFMWMMGKRNLQELHNSASPFWIIELPHHGSDKMGNTQEYPFYHQRWEERGWSCLTQAAMASYMTKRCPIKNKL